MSINGFAYSNLNDQELNKIKMLEDELNQDRVNKEQLIILAFQDEK